MARELTDREISVMQTYLKVMDEVKSDLSQAYRQLYDDADDCETMLYVNEWYEKHKKSVLNTMMQGCIKMTDILSRD